MHPLSRRHIGKRTKGQERKNSGQYPGFWTAGEKCHKVRWGVLGTCASVSHRLLGESVPPPHHTEDRRALYAPLRGPGCAVWKQSRRKITGSAEKLLIFIMEAKSVGKRGGWMSCYQLWQAAASRGSCNFQGPRSKAPAFDQEVSSLLILEKGTVITSEA